MGTAESCTGGLIAAIITEVPGASDVFDRGFVTYSNHAKIQQLSVPEALILEYGAVSRQVAGAMAEGALRHASATHSVAVTGIAGPGGGTSENPDGLVYLAAATHGSKTVFLESRYGDIGRRAVRLATVRDALDLLRRLL